MSSKYSSLISTALAACAVLLGSLSIPAAAQIESQPTPAPTSTKQSKGTTDISVTLAKAELSKLGISNPTQAQLDAALNGGTITKADGNVVPLKGVMTQRDSGMGWGQIANAMGVKLGAVISAAKTADKRDAADKKKATAQGDAVKKEVRASSGESGHGGAKGGSGGNGGNGGGGGGSKK